MNQPLIVDTDPGLDDALALSYLWKKHDIDLITTAAGNTSINNATNNAAYLRDEHNKTTTIRRGASTPLKARRIHGSFHGKTGLGTITADTYNVNDLHAAHIPEKATILCLAPLTNIAEIFQHKQASHYTCFILGGTTTKGNINGEEFNFYADPHAAHQVLNSDATTTLLPIDSLKNAGVPYDDADTYSKDNIAGTMWDELRQRCKKANAPRIRPYDLLAAYMLFHKDTYDTTEHDATVHTDQHRRGRLDLHDGHGINVITDVTKEITQNALKQTLK